MVEFNLSAVEAPSILIASIPRERITSHQQFDPKHIWQGNFDSALWLNFHRGLEHELQLYIKYQDRKKNHKVLIDRCKGRGQHVVLLNGRISIQASGQIKSANVILKGVDSKRQLKIEEFIFKPTQLRPETPLEQSSIDDIIVS